MKNLLLITAILTSQITLADTGGSSTVGPANPAAVNCIKLGGVLEKYENPLGEDSNCVLEEWHLYREMKKRNLVKPHDYDMGGMPNPAAVNCADIGGHIRTIEGPNGEGGYCVVPQWTLFRAINVTRER